MAPKVASSLEKKKKKSRIPASDLAPLALRNKPDQGKKEKKA